VYKEILLLLDEENLAERIKQTQKLIDKDMVNFQIGK